MGICKRVVVPGKKLPSDTHLARQDADIAKDEDDDDNIGESEAAVNTGDKSDKCEIVYRSGTVAYALQCINLILELTKNSGKEYEFDPEFASKYGKDGKPRFIVEQLNDLVVVCSRAITTTYDPVRIQGIAVLDRIVCYFKKA